MAAASRQTMLAGTDVTAQAQYLLELSEKLAANNAAPALVSDVCKILVAGGKAAPVIRRLAYDVLKTAHLQQEDWVFVCQGLLRDISPATPTEVHIRALEMICNLPEPQMVQLAERSDLQRLLLACLTTGSADAQAAAAAALAALYTCPGIIAPLFAAPSLLDTAVKNWDIVVDMCGDAVAKVAHAGLVAVATMLRAHEAALDARDAGKEALVTVLGHFAWSAVIRLHVGASLVLDTLAEMPAHMQVDTVTVLIHAIDLLLTKDPPPRLNPTTGAPYTPEDVMEGANRPIADGWIYTSVGTALMDLLDSPDVAVVTESARGLLHLAWLQKTGKYLRMAIAPAPSEWASRAMSALLRVGDPADAVAAREASTQIICRYLSALQTEEVATVAKAALPWIMHRASASSRLCNLLQLWHAVIDVDLEAWRGPDPLAGEGSPLQAHPHANTLIDILEEPLVRVLRAGTPEAAPGSKDVPSPTLSHELFSSLLETLLTHNANAAIRRAAKASDRSAQPPAANGVKDLRQVIEAASLLEARLMAVEWSQIAQVALQATQGCLGWDTKPTLGCYSATVMTDKWFVVMLRTQHVLRSLRNSRDILNAESLAAPAGSPEESQKKLALKLQDADATLQLMLQKVLTHWKVLSPASKPRAIWVVLHHLRLPCIQERLWESLLDSIRELLLYQPLATSEMHIQELEMSTWNGGLPYSMAAQGVGATERPMLFGGQLLHTPDAADWWDACSEGLAMALLALDKIAQLLTNNFTKFCTFQGYQDLVKSVKTLVMYAMDNMPEGVVTVDRCQSLHDVLSSLVDALPEPVPTEKSEFYDVTTPPPVAAAAAIPQSRLPPPAPTQPQPPAAAPAAPTPPPEAAASTTLSASDVTGDLKEKKTSKFGFKRKPKKDDSLGIPGMEQPAQKGSNVVMSAGKGIGNVLGLRKKKEEKAKPFSARESQSGEAPPPGGADTPADGSAAGAAAGAAAQPGAPAAPPGAAGAAPTAPAAPADGAAPAAALMTPAGKLSTARHRSAPQKPGDPAAVHGTVGKYIGPYLEPISDLQDQQEGFPFGAPSSVTLAESSRMKRHMVLESQLTSGAQSVWEVYRDSSVRPDNSQSLADLVATVGLLPSPMQLAKSIEPNSLLSVAGAHVMAIPGSFVELTSSHEALRLFARVRMDWSGNLMILTLKAQSMLEEEMPTFVVRVQVKGPASWAGNSSWTVTNLAGFVSTSQDLQLSLVASGTVTLQPTILHRVNAAGSARTAVVTAPLQVSLTAQLKPPRVPLPPDVFFQRFHTWHHSCDISGTCKWTGARGGLAVLDLIEKRPFKQVYLKLLPMLGGYQAGYLAYDVTNRPVGLIICSQLVITEPGVSPLTADPSTLAATARCVIRITAHSPSRDAIASMQASPEQWLDELTDGSVHRAVATIKDAAQSRPPLLSNKYAHMAVAFQQDLTPGPAPPEEPAEEEKENGMADAAKTLAAVAQQAARDAQAEQEEEELNVAPIEEQVGDDWLHMAVLAQWQRLRTAVH